MKKIDWDKAYGFETEAFHNTLVHALHQEEEPVKKKSISAVLITAILIIILAATALAVANRAGVMEFIEKWGGYFIGYAPEELTFRTEDGETLMQEEVGDLLVTVTGAAGKDDMYMVTATIEVKPGTEGTLIDQFSTEWEGPEPYTNQTGTDAYYAFLDIYHRGGGADTGDMIANEDGSLSTSAGIMLDEPYDAAQMYCHVNYVKAAPGEVPDGAESTNVFLPFTLALPEPTATRHLQAPVAMEGLGITVEQAYAKQVGDDTRVFLYFRYAGGEAVDYLMPQGLRFTLDTGEGGGAALQLHPRWVNADRCYGSSLMDAEKGLPDALTLIITDRRGEKEYGRAVLPLAEGKPDMQTIEPYRDRYQAGRDLRDMMFAWTEYEYHDEAYLKAPQGESIAVYRDPLDEETLIGHFYGGLGVEPNVPYKGWYGVSIYLDEMFFTYGFVRPEQLVYDEADVTDGLPMAKVQAKEAGYAELRIIPQEGSTIASRVEDGQAVIITAEMDAWYFICDTEGNPLGNIEKTSVALTGEYTHTSMPGMKWQEPKTGIPITAEEMAGFATYTYVGTEGGVRVTLPQGIAVEPGKTYDSYPVGLEPTQPMHKYLLGMYMVNEQKGGGMYFSIASGWIGTGFVEGADGTLYEIPTGAFDAVELDGDATETDLAGLINALNQQGHGGTTITGYAVIVTGIPMEGEPFTQLFVLPME